MSTIQIYRADEHTVLVEVEQWCANLRIRIVYTLPAMDTGGATMSARPFFSLAAINERVRKCGINPNTTFGTFLENNKDKKDTLGEFARYAIKERLVVNFKTVYPDKESAMLDTLEKLMKGHWLCKGIFQVNAEDGSWQMSKAFYYSWYAYVDWLSCIRLGINPDA